MNELPTDEAAPGRMLLEFIMNRFDFILPGLKVFWNTILNAP
jgi:hypothetical protein